MFRPFDLRYTTTSWPFILPQGMLHMCGVLPLKPELIIEEFPILKYGSYSHCMMKGVSIPICMRKESFYSLHVGVMTVCMSIGLHARWMEFSVAWWRELRKFLPSLGLSSINYVKLKDSFVFPQSVIKPCPSQGSRCHRSDQLITVARICAAIAQTRYRLSSLHHPRSTTAAIRCPGPAIQAKLHDSPLLSHSRTTVEHYTNQATSPFQSRAKAESPTQRSRR